MASTTIINPATGKKIAEYDRISINEAKDKIAQSKITYDNWKNTTFAERSLMTHKLAEILDENKEAFAQLATREMGKTITQSRKEIEKCAWICRYYADNAK